MIKINDDTELVKTIMAKLKSNAEQYGKRYCPCVIPELYNTDDNVCMCKAFRELEEGECHCGLYIKTKD